MKELIKWCLVILGIVLIAHGIYYLNQDLKYSTYDNDVWYFHEKKYVGGDAYNYIISAARSAAVMIKSLIYVVLGSSALLISRTIHK